jgi:pimeloyl-ACP methyl ester carboxylesterase
MSEGTTTSPLSAVLVHGALADSSSWTPRDRAAAGTRDPGHGGRQPAARQLDRQCVHRQCLRPQVVAAVIESMIAKVS